jgi:hypothetical protein
MLGRSWWGIVTDVERRLRVRVRIVREDESFENMVDVEVVEACQVRPGRFESCGFGIRTAAEGNSLLVYTLIVTAAALLL